MASSVLAAHYNHSLLTLSISYASSISYGSRYSHTSRPASALRRQLRHRVNALPYTQRR